MSQENTYQVATLPPDENQRLVSLRALHLLDTPIEERFERITRLACHVLGVPMASFTLIDDKRQWFKSEQGMAGSEDPREISFCAHTILGDEIMEVSDATKDARFASNPLVTGAPFISFYAGFPVRTPDGSKVGTLCALDTSPRIMTAEHQQILRDLAALVETELRLTMLSQAQGSLLLELDYARQQSLIDPLTRVWNRAGMTELMKRAWSEAIRHQTEVTLIVADIDHFKQVNDTFGHPAGDEVLKGVARALIRALRVEDVVARMGGEEFLILLPGCTKDKALETAERLRLAIENSRIETDAGIVPITMSLGVSTVIPQYGGEDSEAVIKKADVALYTAKKSGRNQTAISE